jgi:multidrug efflux system membrane fusion protein
LAVKVREGQLVKQGEILAEIDARIYRAQLAQAEGQYARDKAMLDEARLDLERFKEAFAKHAIAGQQVDVQQATVLQDEGTLRVDQAQIDNAQVNLDYCTIRSPIGGRVGLRLVDPGNIVHAGDANGLLVITQIQPISVVFSVAEDYLDQVVTQIRKRQRLPVDALDRTEQKSLASGTVSALDNQIDATTGTVRLRAVFANQNAILFPNQFVNAKMLVSTEHGAILIPNAAIQRNGDKAYVYVVKPDQTVEMRNITTGITDGNVTAVTGVQPGETLVTDGFDKLQDGAKVAVQQNGGSGGGNQQGAQQGAEQGNQQGSEQQGNQQGNQQSSQKDSQKGSQSGSQQQGSQH